ncbi:phosphate/phosphite/phosphonate ABC transporter substrate-binding protein [Brevibacillus brevis]|uniref:Phosphate/phosphite/phosphonate ABC transporter substrate-binding protein n=1 Tax=Brevibacillus brevis TaxID=1393 RepID=A0ABY9T5V1_BREBE|nr:phosphate/phosphite/phosphonate ABC transporter substrate-binding protein [Brevibacillus brevis]WNC15465.1 phosphate/phosphite/phosphonate ABC transporter substrate-binding protein [Brevibacillus brevis]
MKKRFVLGMILALTAMLAVGCGSNNTAPAGTNAANETNAAKASKPEKLRVALLPDESPSTVITNNTALKEYLSKTLNMEVELVVTTDYSSMIEAMRNGKIDVGYYGPLSYVLLKQKMENAVAFAAKVENGSPTYQAVVIAGADTGIQSLSDVKGKTVAYGDVSSTSSHLIPKEMLLSEGKAEAGKDYEEQFVGAHDAVAMAVQNGNAQAGGLSKPIFESMVEKGTIDPNKVKVIAESKPYPNYPWVLNGELDAELQEQIKQAFYNLKDEAVLKPLKGEGFAPIEDKDYDVIRNMVELLGVDLESV